MRGLAVVSICALLAGCGDDDDVVVDGSVTADGGVTADGALSADTGTMTTGCSTPAAGKACIVATFSAPTGGYTGSTAAYTSVESNGKAEISTSGATDNLAFQTGDGSTTVRRNLNLSVDTVSPVVGMDYPVTGTGPDVVLGNLMEYAELTLSTVTTRSWICNGTITFDAIAGKTYRFHFTGTCGPYSGGVGGITVTGTGAGTLP